MSTYVNPKEKNGYEYEVTGYCERTGKPIVAPIAWSSQLGPRPHYATCACHGRKK